MLSDLRKCLEQSVSQCSLPIVSSSIQSLVQFLSSQVSVTNNSHMNHTYLEETDSECEDFEYKILSGPAKQKKSPDKQVSQFCKYFERLLIPKIESLDYDSSVFPSMFHNIEDQMLEVPDLPPPVPAMLFEDMLIQSMATKCNLISDEFDIDPLSLAKGMFINFCRLITDYQYVTLFYFQICSGVQLFF